MINVGTNSISNMMIGSTQVNKTYVGTTLVWEYQTGGLPSGYTEVDYISSTAFGEQYIDLDILLYDTLNKDYDIAIKFNAIGSGQLDTTTNITQATIFNCQQNVSPYPGTFIRVLSKNNKSTNTITGRYIGGTAKDNTLGTICTDIELAEKTPPAKNVTNLSNSNKTHNWGTSLFCIFNNADKTARIRYIEAKLYYFKLFVEGTLVRDMVPCINPNNVVGLYDLVNSRFYSSPNGAAFITNNESYYAGKYLTFQALQNGTFSFSNDISYSIDNGQTWTTLTAGTQSPTITTGNTILWKGNLTATSADGIGTFSSTGKFTAYGNVMSLIYGDNFEGNNTITMTSCFRKLFYNGNIVYAHNLILPATTLYNQCYYSMFQNCVSLITAPELPATRLASYCYSNMFVGCTSLVNAPELPATTLTVNCYEYMFQSCTSLTTAPELPATTLASYCYYAMFVGCTSLTTAPALPATTLASNCYRRMFTNCTSLTTAPSELPATTLASDCYNQMFSGCTALTAAPNLPATTLVANCYKQMFTDCTSLTTTPELPATTLANNCYRNMFTRCSSLVTVSELPATTLDVESYRGMFLGCTSLTSAPELPATTLTTNCYYYMFNGCNNLNYIKMMATDISATNCLNNWVSGVSSIGTFVKNANATWTDTGESGVPSGWLIITE